jgi:hypothetical protein
MKTPTAKTPRKRIQQNKKEEPGKHSDVQQAEKDNMTEKEGYNEMNPTLSINPDK